MQFLFIHFVPSLLTLNTLNEVESFTAKHFKIQRCESYQAALSCYQSKANEPRFVRENCLRRGIATRGRKFRARSHGSLALLRECSLFTLSYNAVIDGHMSIMFGFSLKLPFYKAN